jgi:trk system potassium uptake protein TrkA
MFVLIVGCGRVGSAIAKRMLKQGHDVSVLDESEEAHALLDYDLDQTWEDSGGRFTVGTALEVEALDAAGIQQADVVVCSTDGDNTNIVVAQIAKKRFQVPKVVVRVLDPYRADWYSQQGLHTVCPTQVAIEMLTEAVSGPAGGEEPAELGV